MYERADHYVAEAAKVYLKGKDDEANNQKRISLLRLSEDTINDFVRCSRGDGADRKSVV